MAGKPHHRSRLEIESISFSKSRLVADRNARLFGTSQYEEFRNSRNFFFILAPVFADDPTLRCLPPTAQPCTCNGFQPPPTGPGPNPSWNWKQPDRSQMHRIALSDFHFHQPTSGPIEPKFADGHDLDVESSSRAENSRLIRVETSPLSWVSRNREAVRIR